jgi:hypothetical protein
MSQEILIQLLIAFVGLLGTWGLIAYHAGRLTKSQENTDQRVDALEQVRDRHQELIEGHAIDIAKINEWKAGFQAAASMRAPNVSIDNRS